MTLSTNPADYTSLEAFHTVVRTFPQCFPGVTVPAGSTLPPHHPLRTFEHALVTDEADDPLDNFNYVGSRHHY